MIKYYVRTTGERCLDDTFSQIEYEYLYDREHKKGEIFAQQLLEVSDNDVVLLEDDIILCKDFKERAEKIITEHKDDIINFFTSPEYYFESGYNAWFCYNQCVYIPQQLIIPLSKELQNAYEYLKEKVPYTPTPEPMFQQALSKLHIKTYCPRPCLVQHIDDGSLMEHYRKGRRRCIYFIDYLEKLNISYENAKLNENKIKLKELMDSQFAEIDSKVDYKTLQDCRNVKNYINKT